MNPEPLNLEATECTPSVRFDPASSTLMMEGESYPENVSAFYEPIFAWVKQTAPSLESLRVVLFFSYLNTSSTKSMLDFFQMLEDLHLSGSPKLEVVWRHRNQLEVMREAGEELAEDFRLPIQLEGV